MNWRLEGPPKIPPPLSLYIETLHARVGSSSPLQAEIAAVQAEQVQMTQMAEEQIAQARMAYAAQMEQAQMEQAQMAQAQMAQGQMEAQVPQEQNVEARRLGQKMPDMQSD